MTKPWHDTPLHACADGKQGPVTPQLNRPVANPRYPANALRCCACGERWHEADQLIVAHAWWSVGAYEGKEAERGE
jgi:hypothetical protein